MSVAEQLLAGLVSARPGRVKPGAIVVLISDGVAYVSGQVALGGSSDPLAGKVGDDTTIEQAAAETVNAVAFGLSRLAEAVGSLDAVDRILKLALFDNAVDDLTEQPQVANGASKVLHEVMGTRGWASRSALGVARLPPGVPVGVELVAKVRG